MNDLPDFRLPLWYGIVQVGYVDERRESMEMNWMDGWMDGRMAWWMDVMDRMNQ
jgi:hypothetical protein